MDIVPTQNATIFVQTTTQISDNGTHSLSDVTLLFTSLESESKSKMSELEKTARVVIPIVFTIITVVGFVGNILVITVVALNKTMRNSTNMLVVTLAISDLSFLAFCVPFTACKYTMTVWIFGEIWCRFSSYMIYVCCSASIYTLVLMSLDRLFAVAYAISFPKIRERRYAGIAIFIVCTAVFLANIPALLHHRIESHAQGKIVTCMLDTKVQRTFFITFMGLGFILPVLLISFTYGLMLVKVRQLSKCGTGQAMNKAKRKVTIMCVTVVVVFVFCWMPVHIILPLRDKSNNSEAWIWSQIVANCLAYMNSCLNPILYNITSSVFRKAFKNALGFQTCRGKGTPIHGRESSKLGGLTNNAEHHERALNQTEKYNHKKISQETEESELQWLNS